MNVRPARGTAEDLLLMDKQRDAYRAVKRAKWNGDLIVGACTRSDDSCRGRIEAHHEDYDKPLDVLWLCAHHHRQLHRSSAANPQTKEAA